MIVDITTEFWISVFAFALILLGIGAIGAGLILLGNRGSKKKDKNLSDSFSESFNKAEQEILKGREADIKFWFSEKDTRYRVEMRDDIRHLDLMMAAFDLLAKAIKTSDDMTGMEYTREA